LACWQFVFSCLYMMILVGVCSNLVIGGSIDLWLLLLPSVCGCLASTFAQGIEFMSIEGIEVTVYKKVITVCYPWYNNIRYCTGFFASITSFVSTTNPLTFLKNKLYASICLPKLCTLSLQLAKHNKFLRVTYSSGTGWFSSQLVSSTYNLGTQWFSSYDSRLVPYIRRYNVFEASD